MDTSPAASSSRYDIPDFFNQDRTVKLAITDEDLSLAWRQSSGAQDRIVRTYKEKIGMRDRDIRVRWSWIRTRISDQVDIGAIDAQFRATAQAAGEKRSHGPKDA